jgi:hypothetical protein
MISTFSRTVREVRKVMRWCAHKVRDIARGYSDADIESMQLKLDSGNRKFTNREHNAYVSEVQQDIDQ